MLRIRFLNVGDGDAILIEELSPGRTFRMLVDAGREVASDSAPCGVCASHLRRAGVTRLDKIVITHLHGDHIGGLGALMGDLAVTELVSGYIPLFAGEQIAPRPRAGRTVRGMIDCVNRFSRDVAALRQSGCRTTELFASHLGVRLTERLSADFIVPNVRALRLQREVWNHMLEGRPVSDQKKSRAAKLRNPNSLRIRLRYAGREIELSGDCYASVWEKDEIAPCDIFKTPHHGDEKSVTDVLLAKLRPAHAVISCSRSYDSDRDRPSARAISQLRRGGAKVWFTDEYDDGLHPVRSRPWVEFVITDDGRIIPPED